MDGFQMEYKGKKNVDPAPNRNARQNSSLQGQSFYY